MCERASALEPRRTGPASASFLAPVSRRRPTGICLVGIQKASPRWFRAINNRQSPPRRTVVVGCSHTISVGVSAARVLRIVCSHGVDSVGRSVVPRRSRFESRATRPFWPPVTPTLPRHVDLSIQDAAGIHLLSLIGAIFDWAFGRHLLRAALRP
jgi:hypothetical protein